MLIKIGLGILAVLILFFGYVATKESKFNYEYSEVFKATPDKIFPYLSIFKLGSEWSPYEKVDPNLKKTIHGIDGQVGTIMEFEGNSQAGTGKLEILNIVPNEMVQLKLTMTKPVFAENIIVYKLTPEGEGTRFTWGMSGDGGYIGKLIATLIDCEKMIIDQFKAGMFNLHQIVEAPPEAGTKE